MLVGYPMVPLNQSSDGGLLSLLSIIPTHGLLEFSGEGIICLVTHLINLRSPMTELSVYMTFETLGHSGDQGTLVFFSYRKGSVAKVSVKRPPDLVTHGILSLTSREIKGNSASCGGHPLTLLGGELCLVLLSTDNKFCNSS